MIKYLVMRVWVTGHEMHVGLWNDENNFGVELTLRHYGCLRQFLHLYLMHSHHITVEAIMYLYKECATNGYF